MKKNKLLKVSLIVIAVLILGSWIIPASIYSNGTFSKIGHEPLGILDIFFAPLQFFNWGMEKTQLSTDGTSILAYSYSSILLVIFTTGIFYSILNKTGAYGKLVKDVVNKFKGSEKLFFFLTAIFFFLFSTFIGTRMLAFILIPFFATVLLKLKHSKISAFVATFFATLLGSIVSITGSDVTGINNVMNDLVWNDYLFFRLLLLLLVFIIFMIYVLKKKEPELEKEDIVEEMKEGKKGYGPILILSFVFFLFFLIGSYSWYYVFKTTSVTNAYENLMSTTILGYPLSMNLLGMIEPFGYWSGFTVSSLLLVLSAIISFIYSISWNEILECMKDGIKKMAKPAIYVLLAFIPMIMIKKMGGSTTFLTTIIGFLHNSIGKLEVPFTILATAIYGIFIGDYYAVSSLLNGILMTSYQYEVAAVAVLVMQMTHGLICLAAPTSIFLVTGLGYLKIPYQKWLSYIWKLILLLFIVVMIILFILSSSIIIP